MCTTFKELEEAYDDLLLVTNRHPVPSDEAHAKRLYDCIVNALLFPEVRAAVWNKWGNNPFDFMLKAKNAKVAYGKNARAARAELATPRALTPPPSESVPSAVQYSVNNPPFNPFKNTKRSDDRPNYAQMGAAALVSVLTHGKKNGGDVVSSIAQKLFDDERKKHH